MACGQTATCFVPKDSGGLPNTTAQTPRSCVDNDGSGIHGEEGLIDRPCPMMWRSRRLLAAGRGAVPRTPGAATSCRFGVTLHERPAENDITLAQPGQQPMQVRLCLFSHLSSHSPRFLHELPSWLLEGHCANACIAWPPTTYASSLKDINCPSSPYRPSANGQPFFSLAASPIACINHNLHHGQVCAS